MTRMMTLLALLTVLSINATNAALIVGNIYEDSDGAKWEYIGPYDIREGPPPDTLACIVAPEKCSISGIQAAEQIYGELAPGLTYAISTVEDSVNHGAWYAIFNPFDPWREVIEGPEDLVQTHYYAIGPAEISAINYVFVSVPASSFEVTPTGKFRTKRGGIKTLATYIINWNNTEPIYGYELQCAKDEAPYRTVYYGYPPITRAIPDGTYECRYRPLNESPPAEWIYADTIVIGPIERDGDAPPPILN